ncbi:MAG: hypothetical protein GEU86_16230 [Actinophytocola sp.]|nr:hypothetical protein [Actinophytocola sp.]
MGEFVAVLLGRIENTGRGLAAARHAGHPYEAELHLAMLADLAHTAREYNVALPVWVEPELCARERAR